MASRAVAVVLCAFAPCSGFVTPVRVAGGGASDGATRERRVVSSHKIVCMCNLHPFTRRTTEVELEGLS